MATLTDAMKVAIVQRLACYFTPEQVAQAVTLEFGVTVDRRQVQKFDPDRSGKKPAARWVDLFDATRERYLAEIDTIAIAHRAYRLRELLQLYWKARERQNIVLAAELLEQSAKETGGIYTNPRAMTDGRDEPLPAIVVRRETRAASPAGVGQSGAA